MGDFHQNGIITTLHNMRERTLSEMEKELNLFSSQRPMGLILPSLYSELEGDALSKIVSELTKVSYLDQIVIGLDRANEKEYKSALNFFSRLPQNVRVLWNDGPRLRTIDKKLRRNWGRVEMFGIVWAIRLPQTKYLQSLSMIVILRPTLGSSLRG